MNKKISLHQITKKYLDCPYVLGGRNPKTGLDCFSFLKLYCKDIGVKFPDKYGLYNLDNYIEYYRRGTWLKPYKGLIRSLGNSIDIKYSKAFDILVMKGEPTGISVGINVGNGKAMVITTKGITTWSIDNLHILEVIRCQQS